MPRHCDPKSRAIVAMIGLTMLVGVTSAQAEDAATPAPVAAARAASKELGEALKAQLMAAMKSGGPVAALAVCNTAAPSIAADISKTLGLEVGRTALRVRNPNNAPDDFERRVLEDFAAKLAAGADPATLEHSETVTLSGANTLRYMKAIPMAAEPCAACHGTDVKPDVKAEIDKLYPQDQATGFKPGELRGAFTISMPVK